MNEDKDYVDCGDVHLARSQYRDLNIDDPSDSDETKRISIVHISDTHQKHHYMNDYIPSGDILVHTGDFLYKCRSFNDDGSLPQKLIDFNEWIGKQPHKIKIVICGNHEGVLSGMKPTEIANILSNVTHYLQDSEITVYGIKFYGIPWHIINSKNKAFGIKEDNITELHNKIDLIPHDTDILLSHLPPFNILDLAWREFYHFPNKCKICKQTHTSYAHWGSQYLLQEIIKRIKPKACLFGHVHDSPGHVIRNNILFCNSAMYLNYGQCHKFDVVFDLINCNKTGLIHLINGFFGIKERVIPRKIIEICLNYYGSEIYKAANKSDISHLSLSEEKIMPKEGDRNTGESDDEYVIISSVLMECDNVEWKRYLNNFKKHKINDKRLKFIGNNDEKVWQELFPEFEIRHQFKVLWELSSI